MSPRRVAIIILTWNGLEFTQRCLASLRRCTDHPAFDVIVVDNGSSDGTVDYLRSLSWVKVIDNPINLGFVVGNNQGIAHADPAADVVLLNNDVMIDQPDWLTRLQALAHSAKEIGVVGCRLRWPDGRLQHAGAEIWPDNCRGEQIGGQELDVNQFNADREVDSVTFACVYLKRELMDAIGGLDEDYFSYFEDTDYCFKARAAGFRVLCSGSVTLEHHENASTTANRVSHSKLFRTAQRTFRRKWGRHLETTRYQQTLDWRSIVNFPTGYATSCRMLLQALDRQGVRNAYRYVFGPGTGFPVPEPAVSELPLVNLLAKRPFQRGGVQVVYGYGDRFCANEGGYRIGYTMLETDGIPAEWVRQANQMDEVWVPSAFNRDTFRASGVTRPIHIVPLGIDPDYFNPGIRVFRELSRPYRFLSIFEWGERKAPEVLLRAFTDEFDADEDAILICKVMNQDPEVNVHEQIEQLGLRPGGGRIVLSLNDVVPAHQIGCLYRAADCFVLGTRGEGWGMPILEAMACGLPVIATNWSAHRDFLHADNGYLLEVEKLVPAQAKCPFYQGFKWAQPSYDHLRCLLRHVYEHQAEAREVGARAAIEARERWTWRHSAATIVQRLREIEQLRGRRAA